MEKAQLQLVCSQLRTLKLCEKPFWGEEGYGYLRNDALSVLSSDFDDSAVWVVLMSQVWR